MTYDLSATVSFDTNNKAAEIVRMFYNLEDNKDVRYEMYDIDRFNLELPIELLKENIKNEL